MLNIILRLDESSEIYRARRNKICSVLRDVQIITSVELVKGWCVKGIQQIGEIWLGQITAGTKTESC